jgi:site-specific recombinase XerC
MKKSEIEKLSSKVGGSTLSKKDRTQHITHVLDTLKKENMRVPSLRELTSKHVEKYISSQKAAGISDRSLQNRMTSLRTSLRAIGRDKLADSERLSTKELKIDNASRDGTHRALSQAEYEQAYSAAAERSTGFSACLDLMRELGLRSREAVQSVESLKQWERSLERGAPVRVLHGTKGGRPRDAGAIDQERALKAVRNAIDASKEGEGRLIRSETLQGAMRAFGRHCEAIGLTGEHASHALRCMYAQDRYMQHLEAMGSRKEALAATSLDLGHGDGRGTYVAQVYLKNQ